MVVSKFKEYLMRKWFVSLSLASGAAFATAGSAQAQNDPVPPPPVQVQQIQIQVQVQGGQAVQVQPLPAPKMMPGAMVRPGFGGSIRLTQADAIFVGRVVAIEPMDIEATQV